MSARASSSARIAMNGQLGPEAAAAAAIETELGGLQPAKGSSDAKSSLRGRLARRPAGRDAGSRGQGFAGPRDDRRDPARFGRDRGASRPPPGRPAAPLRSHPAPDLGALRRRNARGQAGPRSPRGIRPLPPPVERAHLARGHRRLSDRRARHPRPRGGGPKGCAAGTPRRCRRRRSKPGPIAPRGGATRPEPRPRVPA